MRLPGHKRKPHMPKQDGEKYPIRNASYCFASATGAAALLWDSWSCVDAKTAHVKSPQKVQNPGLVRYKVVIVNASNYKLKHDETGADFSPPLQQRQHRHRCPSQLHQKLKCLNNSSMICWYIYIRERERLICSRLPTCRSCWLDWPHAWHREGVVVQGGTSQSLT